MAELLIEELTDPQDPRLAQVAEHFQQMYVELDLPHRSLTSVQQWTDAARRALGRTMHVRMAMLNNELVASMHSTLVLAPAYLGGERSAMIHHTYVPAPYRGKGFAKALALSWLAAMQEKGIHAFQLHVTAGNAAAMAFWRSIGFQEELTQLTFRSDQ